MGRHINHPFPLLTLAHLEQNKYIIKGFEDIYIPRNLYE